MSGPLRAVFQPTKKQWQQRMNSMYTLGSQLLATVHMQVEGQASVEMLGKLWRLATTGSLAGSNRTRPYGDQQDCAELLVGRKSTCVEAGQRQALLVRVRAIEVAARLAPEAAVALCRKCGRYCMAADKAQSATECTAAWFAQ